MNQFNQLPIDKDVVVICSGESRNDVHKEDYEKLKEKYFVIALNFVDNIVPHARIWSDTNVTDYLQDTEKDCLWVTRLRAVHPQTTRDMSNDVDYWFNDKQEKFDPNYKWTLYWLLQLMKKYFPQRKVYLFGVDCQDDKSYIFEDNKIKHRKNKKNNCNKMPMAFKWRKNNEPGFFDNFYNCNFFSAVGCIQYVDYKDLL